MIDQNLVNYVNKLHSKLDNKNYQLSDLGINSNLESILHIYCDRYETNYDNLIKNYLTSLSKDFMEQLKREVEEIERTKTVPFILNLTTKSIISKTDFSTENLIRY